MLAKAVKNHHPDAKGATLHPQQKAHASPLKPLPPSAANNLRTPWLSSSNPLKRTASQLSGNEDSRSNQEEMVRKRTSIDRSNSPLQGARLDQLHCTVFYDENDFEDDNEIDLDADSPVTATKHPLFESSATLMPSGRTTEFSATLRPDRISDVPITPRTPASSAPLPWSSSPPTHQMTASNSMPRVPYDTTKMAKRRTLPWLEDSSISAGTREQSTEEIRPRGPPAHVQEVIARHKSRTASMEDAEEKFTPLPKDKQESPYPWNKTASAVKEEQKKLRQGHKNLIKDNKADPFKVKKKKETVARVFLSDEQKSVLDLVLEKHKSVFFTGSAGTGKSVLLRETIKVLRRSYKREPDRVAVTASTGLAACNIGGVTLHSFAGIGLGKEDVPALVRKVKKSAKAKNRWMRTKVLIIDEISMVDGELFDKLEAVARSVRNNGRPFGGIQLVITGDFFQLPPVPDRNQVARFAFDAATWNTSIEHTIGLTQVFRQKDPVFANMLNEMRLGKLTSRSIDSFRALCRPLSFADDFESTELFPTRYEVDNANNARMRNLGGKEFEFKAEDGGSMTDHVQRDRLLANCMAAPSIKLKKGAQVMLIKNIDETLVNGSVGKVIAFMDEKTFDIYHEDEGEFNAVETMDINDEEMSSSRMKLKHLINKDLVGDTGHKWPLVRFSIQDGTTRDLLCQRESWKIELPNGEVQASRSQIPLILAWALSIHKAQGQTLERVKVDLGKIFEKGQAYVALSRATCQEGLQIIRFDPAKVMAHDRVRTFYDSLYSIHEANAKVNEGNDSKVPTALARMQDMPYPGHGMDEDEDALAALHAQ